MYTKIEVYKTWMHCATHMQWYMHDHMQAMHPLDSSLWQVGGYCGATVVVGLWHLLGEAVDVACPLQPVDPVSARPPPSDPIP